MIDEFCKIIPQSRAVQQTSKSVRAALFIKKVFFILKGEQSGFRTQKRKPADPVHKPADDVQRNDIYEILPGKDTVRGREDDDHGRHIEKNISDKGAKIRIWHEIDDGCDQDEFKEEAAAFLRGVERQIRQNHIDAHESVADHLPGFKCTVLLRLLHDIKEQTDEYEIR